MSHGFGIGSYPPFFTALNTVVRVFVFEDIGPEDHGCRGSGTQGPARGASARRQEIHW